MFYYVAIPIYNGFLILGYATVYTCLPVFCLIFDQDISYKKAMDYPAIYQSMMKNRDMSK